jgi:enoyl-CoA hydratase
MTYESLLVSAADGVATLVVNRPERRNALNTAVRREIADVLDALRDDDAVRVVVFTGAGEKAFIAGADIGEFAERTALEQRATMVSARVYDVIAGYPKPTIAMIHGYCLGGGCELAIACDLRIADRSARFGQPEIKLGLLPGGGGTQRLPRLVGFGRAMRMILTGEMIDAAEADRIGLVDWLVDDDQLQARTTEIATTLAAYSPVALALIKESVRAAFEMPMAAGLQHERELFVAAFASDDGREGVRAFLEKRAPAFHGH